MACFHCNSVLYSDFKHFYVNLFYHLRENQCYFKKHSLGFISDNAKDRLLLEE